MRWLFIEPGRIGDWINSSVAVREFARANKIQLELAVRQEIKPLISKYPDVHNIVLLPLGRNYKEYLKVLSRLLRERYDGCCVLSPGRSGWALSKAIRSPIKMGYLEYPRPLKDLAINAYGTNKTVCKYEIRKDHLIIRALKAIGADTKGLDYSGLINRVKYHPQISLDDLDFQKSKTYLLKLGMNMVEPFVLLHPGVRWKCKQWTEPGWTELSLALVKQGNQVLLGVGSGETELLTNISMAPQGRVFHLHSPLPLNIYAAIIKQARLLISPDTGVMHLAAALGTPVIGIFGPTSPSLSGPVGSADRVAVAQLESPPACYPCNHPTEDIINQECRCNSRYCMKGLDPTVVLEAVRSLSWAVPF